MTKISLSIAILCALSIGAQAECPSGIDGMASTPLVTLQAGATRCGVLMSANGYQLPDPLCTPGAINPTLTVDVLRDPSFRTSCVRSHATTEGEKAQTYAWYVIRHPEHNTGANQVCELDHLVPLELGGADTLDNIWPQCGPDGVSLSRRYFKQKDEVENWLAAQVRSGAMDLATAQHGIAADWTQYLTKATR